MAYMLAILLLLGSVYLLVSGQLLSASALFAFSFLILARAKTGRWFWQ